MEQNGLKSDQIKSKPNRKSFLPASFKRSPSFSVLFVLSEPARSHNDNWLTAMHLLSCQGDNEYERATKASN